MLIWVVALIVSSYVAVGLGVWLAFYQFAYPHLTPQQQAEICWKDALILVFLWWMLLFFDDEMEGPHD